MTESLKFLQNMQEITQLEIDQLDAAGQLTDVWNRPAIVKLPESYLKKLAAASFTPGIFLLAPSSVIRGALLVDSKHRLLIWQNLRSCTQHHLEQAGSAIWFGLNQHWPKIHKTFENELPLPEHILENHNSYELEKQMLSAVRNGDDSSYQHYFRLLTSSGAFGQVAKDRLRNQKNLLICHITLLTRQAIEGGLAPNEAFALSDQLCQQVESLQTIEQLNARLQAIGQIFIQRIQTTRQAQNNKKGLLTQKLRLPFVITAAKTILWMTWLMICSATNIIWPIFTSRKPAKRSINTRTHIESAVLNPCCSGPISQLPKLLPSLALQPPTMPRAALKKSSVLHRSSIASATS